jgi:hypothetical protein
MLWRCPSVRPSVVISVFRTFFWNLVYCFVVKSYCFSSRFGVIDPFLQELCPWNLAEFQIFQFSGLFIAIFASIRLKLGVLLCSQELLFQFAFRCDWSIFARVMPLEFSRISDFSVFRTFFAIFAGIGLKLGVLLCSQELLFQIEFQCDWFLFARVTFLDLWWI